MKKTYNNFYDVYKEVLLQLSFINEKLVKSKGVFSRFGNKFNGETASRAKELLKISMPIVIEQIFTVMLGIVNTMMAARLGMYAISAISMIDSITNIIISVFSALTVGCTIVVSQYLGRHELKNAKNASAQSAFLSVIVSLLLFVVFMFFKQPIIGTLYKDAAEDVFSAANTYLGITVFSFTAIALTQTIYGILRGAGDTRTPMVITIIMNVVNIIFGYVLIIGVHLNVFGWFTINLPSRGIVGAATALLISRYLGLVLSLLHILVFSKTIKLNKLEYFKPSFAMQKVILGIGIPTSVESSLFQVGRLITQVFIVSMGTAAMAANSIGGSYFGIIAVPGNAFATGVMILVGQRIGRGQKDDVLKTVMFSIKTGMVLMGILCVVSFPFTGVIGTIYKADADTLVYLKQLLYSCFLLTPLIWAVSFITPSALRATGDVKFAMIVSVASMWLFRIGSGYILGVKLGLGVLGVWGGMYIDWVVRGIIFTIRLKHGKWKDKEVLKQT